MKKKEPLTEEAFRQLLYAYDVAVGLYSINGLKSAELVRRGNTARSLQDRILAAYAADLEARRG